MKISWTVSSYRVDTIFDGQTGRLIDRHMTKTMSPRLKDIKSVSLEFLASTVLICDRTIGTWLHCSISKNNCTGVNSFLKKVLINLDSIIKYWRHLTPMFSNNRSRWPPILQLNSNWNKNQKWLVSYSNLKQEPQGPEGTSIDWSEKPFSILICVHRSFY